MGISNINAIETIIQKAIIFRYHNHIINANLNFKIKSLMAVKKLGEGAVSGGHNKLVRRWWIFSFFFLLSDLALRSKFTSSRFEYHIQVILLYLLIRFPLIFINFEFGACLENGIKMVAFPEALSGGWAVLCGVWMEGGCGWERKKVIENGILVNENEIKNLLLMK